MVHLPLRSGQALPAELAAQAAKLLLLSGRKRGHKLGDSRGVHGKESADSRLTLGRQHNDEHAAIFGGPLAVCQALSF